jgi:hypothetical protein
VAVPVAAAVVAGDPDVQAHVVAELEQAPLDLGVGGRLLGRDGLFVWCLLGCFGGFLAVGHGDGPDPGLEGPGTSGQLGGVYRPGDRVLLGVEDRGHHGMPVGWLPAGGGAAEVAGPGVGVLEVPKHRELVAQLKHWYSRLGGQGGDRADADPGWECLVLPDGVVSLNGSDTTSSTPIQREIPVR